MSTTLPAILSHLDAIDAEFSLSRSTYLHSTNERWCCVITLANVGTELKVRSYSPDGEQAVLSAYNKFLPLLESPAVGTALNLPLLPAA